MTNEALDWLPTEAVGLDTIQAKIRQAVDSWSARWFASRKIVAGSMTPAREAPHTPASPWARHGTAIFFACGRRPMLRLLGWALDADIDHCALSDADRDLLEGFEGRMVSDLISEVETALGIPFGEVTAAERIARPLGRLGGLIVRLEDDRADDLASLAVPLDSIVRLVRASITPTARLPMHLGNFMDALASTPVKLGIDLGSSQISLSEMRGLSKGDVLVLDTPLNMGASISLLGSDKPIATGALTSEDGHLTLALQPRPR